MHACTNYSSSQKTAYANREGMICGFTIHMRYAYDNVPLSGGCRMRFTLENRLEFFSRVSNFTQVVRFVNQAL